MTMLHRSLSEAALRGSFAVDSGAAVSQMETSMACFADDAMGDTADFRASVIEHAPARLRDFGLDAARTEAVLRGMSDEGMFRLHAGFLDVLSSFGGAEAEAEAEGGR